MRRTAVVMCALIVMCGGCLSSPAPSQVPQLPQSQPVVVERVQTTPIPYMPTTVDEAVSYAKAVCDNASLAPNMPPQTRTGLARAVGRLDGILDMARMLRDIQWPTFPKSERAILPAPSGVNPTTPPVNPTTPPGRIARARAWWEHFLDWIGAIEIGIGIVIIGIHAGQVYLGLGTFRGVLRHCLIGVALILVGLANILIPWVKTVLLVVALAVYGLFLYKRHLEKRAATPK